jgi:hypothetical protein
MAYVKRQFLILQNYYLRDKFFVFFIHDASNVFFLHKILVGEHRMFRYTYGSFFKKKNYFSY